MHSMNPSTFYGETRYQLPESSDPLPSTQSYLPRYLSDPLLGPCKVWKVFKKQQEALDFISNSNLHKDLLAYAFETFNNDRLFLVANPDIFWYRDSKKSASCRNTYEIISENSVCKLYFDLEFDVRLNEDSDGNEMVRTFIRLVLFYFYKIYGKKHKMSTVLVLDSSTSHKFSVHLIFQTVVFQNNHHAGNFVKHICNELFNIQNIANDEDQFQFDIFKETTINIYSVKDLFIMNNKNVKTLFCDLSVYSKNRHFRLYKSCKKSKNVPLLVSSINKFKVPNVAEDDVVQYERYIFLYSLITYFVTQVEEDEIRTFEQTCFNALYSDEANRRRLEKMNTGQVSPTKTSPYPLLDQFILTRVRPHGHIFRNVHFPSTNVTVYDIKGFRYCGNIRRWHKSQNIKLIADVNRGVYYQKCHDCECKSYKSDEWSIPPEIMFQIKNDSDEIDALMSNIDEIEGEIREKMCKNSEITSKEQSSDGITEKICERSEINKEQSSDVIKDEITETLCDIVSKEQSSDEITEKICENSEISKEQANDDIKVEITETTCAIISKEKSSDEITEKVCENSEISKKQLNNEINDDITENMCENSETISEVQSSNKIKYEITEKMHKNSNDQSSGKMKWEQSNGNISTESSINKSLEKSSEIVANNREPCRKESSHKMIEKTIDIVSNRVGHCKKGSSNVEKSRKIETNTFEKCLVTRKPSETFNEKLKEGGQPSTNSDIRQKEQFRSKRILHESVNTTVKLSNTEQSSKKIKLEISDAIISPSAVE